MKVSGLQAQGKYVYRYKQVCFYGSGLSAPQRVDDELDAWDTVFDSKENYETWYKDLVLGLATLDQVMNYCQYFQRTKGNEGNYVREGKSHPVDGRWDGYHVEGSALFPFSGFDYKLMKSFRDFLVDHGWSKNWFELMERYKLTEI